MSSAIEAYLLDQAAKTTLRFLTCGSVDDGKSTLIGRLLFDSKMIFEDQLAALEADSKRVGTQGEEIDLALLVDGLAAEREQGITIDVAYRYFATDRRKFVVADTPGHEQYTRNMATGASNADVAVILIDARKGVLTQTRRHSYIVSLFGIRDVVLAVNKMDLVDFSEEVFHRIVDDYCDFARSLGDLNIRAIPMSALKGDNVTFASPALYLHDCLSSLAQQTCKDYEVIVVDNGSCDGSVDYLRSDFPWVKVVRNEENLGFAEGTNSGIREARGDLILTMNNDTKANKDFIKRLIEPMSDMNVGMCASKMLFPDGRINSAGMCISRSGAAWDRGMFEPDTGQYNQQEEVFGPCGGAALYRMEMLEEIGLFDEDFFLYMEDVDLAFRGRLAGWKCVYVPEAEVYHHHGGTAGFGSDLSVYYGNRNVIWYTIKDFPLVLLLTSLPFILARNLAVIPYYVLRGQGRIILKSKLDALKRVPGMLRKRSQIVRKTPENKIAKFIHTWARIARH